MYLNKLRKKQLKYIQIWLQYRQLSVIKHVQVLNITTQKLCPVIFQTGSVSRNLNRLQSWQLFNTNKRYNYTDESIGTSMEKNTDFENNISANNILYSSAKDNLMLQLTAYAQNYKQLFEFLTQNAGQLQYQHYVQSILYLWDIYRLASSAVEASIRQAINEKLQQILLPQLKLHITELDISELSCCYLYLRKMHISNTQPEVQSVLLRALQLIEASSANNIVPLSGLSRLAVGVNLDHAFFTPLVCRNFVPHLERHIDVCATEEQTRLLATCIFQLHPLINANMLHAFKLRVHNLLQEGVLSGERPHALLKVLHMLNLPIWSHLHTTLTRQILEVLAPKLYELEDVDLKSVCRLFLYHQEPAMLTMPLKKATEQLLKTEHTPYALACAVPFALPQQREQYLSFFKQLLYDQRCWLLPNASGHFFYILRSLKIADIKLCDSYWSGVVNELNSSVEEQTQLRFLRHCQRYMNFNNNLGGTYRHYDVERRLSQMAMYAIECDIAGRVPQKFARLASFVLAYGHTPFACKKYPNVILSKILTMQEQLSINDCFLLSRGIEISQELRFRHHIPSRLGTQLATIDSILITCSERHLSQNVELSISELNAIVRTLSRHRKSLKNTMIYNRTLERYKELSYTELTSRAVRDMAYNFITTNFYVPEALDSMFAYIERYYTYITGDTVEKILTCAFNLGYTPKSLKVLNHAAKVLLRDFEYMSGLSLVQACLALCFYKTIPEELINKVFCVKFIQRVEDEIQICYSKATYPERVLNLVMQLNRTVCLDFPEANVPWFQQNFVEAQLTRNSVQRNKFSEDVHRLLKELLKDESYFRCNHTTPYGYKIDFVIHFDRDHKPIPDPVETTLLDRITKVAILLMRLGSFCENDLNVIRGPDSLKVRHLEMMGYKILHINEYDWNSKYMNTPNARTNYLKCLLQIGH